MKNDRNMISNRIVRLSVVAMLAIAMSAPDSVQAQTAPDQSVTDSAKAKTTGKPSMEWQKNAFYKIKYQVPASWTLLKQTNDTMTVATYVSPGEDMLFFIGKWKGAAAQQTPEQALKGMLTEFKVTGNRIFPTRHNRIDFLETTGSAIVQGHLVQYDAMAATHQGNVILVYIYAAQPAYEAHKNTMEEVIHSIAPYRGK